MGLIPFTSKTARLQIELDETRHELSTMRNTLTEAVRQRNNAGARMGKGRKTSNMSRQAVASQRSGGMGGSLFVSENEVFFQTYNAIPWISAPIDTIAKRSTSGGYELVPLQKGADIAEKERIDDVLQWFNRYENFIETTETTLTDLQIFGEGFWEIGWAAGSPDALYYLDPVYMSVVPTEDGREIDYFRYAVDADDPVDLKPNQVVYFRNRGARGQVTSPIRKLLGTATTWNHMQNWWMNWFQNGAKPPFWGYLPEGTDADNAELMRDWFDENFTGAENNGAIPWMFGGAELRASQASAGAMEFDFLASAKFLRETMMILIGMNPGTIGVSDDGNRLTDQSDSQEKALDYNTINPLRRIFEESVTFSFIQQGLGIDDWVMKLKAADYRSDTLISSLIVNQINAGLMTRDEGRTGLGMEKLGGKGGDVAAISLSREVVPVPDLAQIHSSQFQAAQQTALQGTDPHAKPSELIADTPTLPTGVKGIVADTKPPAGQPTEALRDLARWQRIVSRDARRSFVSDAIPADIHAAITEALEAGEPVKDTFDAAFEAVKDKPDKDAERERIRAEGKKVLQPAFADLMKDILGGSKA